MDDTDKFQSYKIEIRSILLPYKNGCYLSEFNRAYYDMIGKRLPFREMGFRTDIEFLYSMPDAVKITPYGRNQYHLMGIADEKSKHIQKMVARQKPAKMKPPPIVRNTRPSRLYNLPPRFTTSKRIQDTKTSYDDFSKRSEVSSTTALKEESKIPPAASFKEESKLSSKTPMEEVIELVQQFKNRLAVDDVLCEYKRMYKKNLSLSTYGFSTIEDCLREIPELEIIERNNVRFVRCCSEIPVSSTKEGNTEAMPVQNADFYGNCDNGNIPATLREKLLKVSERCKNGVLASNFPNYFYEVTGQTLDLVSIGYRCLNDLIDDLPDIFVRKPVPGSKRDCLIYSKHFIIGQDETIEDESSLKHIILNLRKILEAYPEGVKLDEVIHVYGINCKDSLHIKEFGFDDLENFLASIKNNVPLKFGLTDGKKSIHLVKLTDMPDNLQYMAPEAFDKEAIPHHAAFPEFKYKPHTFPPDFDFSLFIPAYTSSVAHAGHLYLQFQEESEEPDALAKLGTELDNFYNGNQSEQYIMKTIHIEVGASCVAKWPTDNHWYRAQILSIPSMQSVRVIYVDYGTTDVIPKFLLRYANKEFIKLPVQAVKCRLAYLKPPNNAPKWDIQTRNRILQLCQNVSLMAKIEEIGPDGVYSVLLCDTNGDDDVYINDLLIKEGLAEGFDFNDDEPVESNFAATEIEPKRHVESIPYLHPLQALQAQYFLQAFATIAPCFAQDEHYLGLKNKVSAICQNSDPISQSNSVPIMPPSGPPGFNTYPQNLNLLNSNTLYNAPSSIPSTFGTNPVRKLKANAITPSKDLYSTSIESTSLSLASPENFIEENEDAENEIFDDDDDETFQQFCSTVSVTNARCVKRVMLGDGYKIHIIVIDSQPYASSGEISQLIWNNKEADYLLNRLQLKDVEIPVVSLSEDGHEQLFQQLQKFNVKGVQKTKGFKSSIVLYLLKYVMKILNIFGHPSVTLRTRLTEEITNFNPNDPYWQENVETSADSIESDDEDRISGIVYSSVTDDDKIERLCLYDLLAMKESIMCKRKKMLSSTELNKSTHEIDKLEHLLQKVLKRIQEIKEICQVFS